MYWRIGIGEHVQNLKGLLLDGGANIPGTNSLVRMCVDRDASPYYSPGVRRVVGAALSQDTGLVYVDWLESQKKVEHLQPRYSIGGNAILDVSGLPNAPLTVVDMSLGMDPHDLGGILYLSTKYFAAQQSRHYQAAELDLTPDVPDQEMTILDLATETKIEFSPYQLVYEILSDGHLFRNEAIFAVGEIVIGKAMQSLQTERFRYTSSQMEY